MVNTRWLTQPFWSFLKTALSIICLIKKVPNPPGLISSNFLCFTFSGTTAVVPENVKHRKLDDIKPGGLGTFFIKQIMDNAVFKKDQNGWVNHLVLTKKI